MQKDNKRYEKPAKFDAEYGVIQNIYVQEEPEYNSNRRTVQSKKTSRLLPGVSPLVYSRFLLDKAAFLSLTDMGKDLPEYEEIPIALKMPAAVKAEYCSLWLSAGGAKVSGPPGAAAIQVLHDCIPGHEL